MENPVQPYHLTNRSFTNMLLCLVWHLPLPQTYAIDTENIIIDLEKTDQLYSNNNIDNIIYNIIHYKDFLENEPYQRIEVFIDRLSVDNNYKEIIRNEIYDIDIYNITELSGIINRYISMIDTIPVG